MPGMVILIQSQHYVNLLLDVGLVVVVRVLGLHDVVEEEPGVVDVRLDSVLEDFEEDLVSKRGVLLWEGLRPGIHLLKDLPALLGRNLEQHLVVVNFLREPLPELRMEEFLVVLDLRNSLPEFIKLGEGETLEEEGFERDLELALNALLLVVSLDQVDDAVVHEDCLGTQELLDDLRVALLKSFNVQVASEMLINLIKLLPVFISVFHVRLYV